MPKRTAIATTLNLAQLTSVTIDIPIESQFSYIYTIVLTPSDASVKSFSAATLPVKTLPSVYQHPSGASAIQVQVTNSSLISKVNFTVNLTYEPLFKLEDAVAFAPTGIVTRNVWTREF